MEALTSLPRLSLNPTTSIAPRHPYRVGFPSRSIRAGARGVPLVLNAASRNRKELICKSSADGSINGDSGNGLRRKRLAVFVSGGGSNFRAIHEATLQGSVHGDVVVLVSDKLDCGGVKYAMDKNISVVSFPKAKSSPDGLSANDLVMRLKNLGVDFVLLAGYLKIIPVELVHAYPRSILNIHPSLLPSFGGKGFYGLKVHKAVIASGARYSGPTIHFVDEHYDTGRILAQRAVPVLAEDTAEELAARVLKEEHKLYVDTVTAICEERIKWRDDGVPLIRSTEDPDKYT